MRIDLNVIANWVAPHSRVLDLGCGDGTLLKQLIHSKQVEGYGLEIENRVPIEMPPKPENVRYMETKKHRLGHLLTNVKVEK